MVSLIERRWRRRKVAAVVAAAIAGTAWAGCNGPESRRMDAGPQGSPHMKKETEPGFAGAEKLVLSEEEWVKRLSPEAYRVLRKKGTERAFTGKFWDSKKEGMYICAACGNRLFSSKTKFDSGTGWPSFSKPVSEGNVRTESDRSFFRTRTEVLCGRCDSHLGHVFDDGPAPTNLRYCINSVALDFEG